MSDGIEQLKRLAQELQEKGPSDFNKQMGKVFAILVAEHESLRGEIERLTSRVTELENRPATFS